MSAIWWGQESDTGNTLESALMYFQPREVLCSEGLPHSVLRTLKAFAETQEGCLLETSPSVCTQASAKKVGHPGIHSHVSALVAHQCRACILTRAHILVTCLSVNFLSPRGRPANLPCLVWTVVGVSGMLGFAGGVGPSIRCELQAERSHR
jgi:hypothetical protein